MKELWDSLHWMVQLFFIIFVVTALCMLVPQFAQIFAVSVVVFIIVIFCIVAFMPDKEEEHS